MPGILLGTLYVDSSQLTPACPSRLCPEGERHREVTVVAELRP